MIIKGLIDEDFINYKKSSMTIEFPYCTFKCDKECNQSICQNSTLIKQPDIEISYDDLLQRYVNNPITKAIVFQGLEPLDSLSDVINLITLFRIKYNCKDDIVIYTGYKEEEKEVCFLKEFLLSSCKEINKNIIIKYGRYIPNRPSRFD